MNCDGAERDAVSERIIECAFTVAKALGSGFLEKVYENALALELRAAGFAILIELKTVRALDGVHRAQCISCLRATGKRLCLLINFGKPRIEVQRVAEDS